MYDFEHGAMPDFPLEEPYYKGDGLLWTSKYNFDFEDKSKRRENVVIHDVTLRDGDQTPGVVLLEEERVRIADALAEMGVPRIEAGMPMVGNMWRTPCAAWSPASTLSPKSTRLSAP